jgi:chemotaxis protein methyltransferase CheR
MSNTLTITTMGYDRFKRFLENACGIILGDGKEYLITSRLTKILRHENITNLDALLNVIEGRGRQDLHDAVIDAMTTNETSWFRDKTPFEILEKVVLTEFEQAGKHSCRVWSSACSSGQEPYTISITFNEFLRAATAPRLNTIQILATDISNSVLAQARQGDYEASVIGRGISAERRDHFFEFVEPQWRIRDDIKRRVCFQVQNLLASYSGLGQFDIIFCRNVLIYFAAERKTDILNRMADALTSKGYLFLGASETIAGYCDRFNMVRTPYGVVYQRKD